MISINWRRGLFRMWIAASFVWLVGGGVMFQEEIRSEFSVMRIEVAGLTDHATPTYDDAMRALRAADEAATSATDPRERQQYEKDARALARLARSLKKTEAQAAQPTEQTEPQQQPTLENVEDARRLAVIVDRFREASPGTVGRARENAQERLIVLTTVLLLPPILLFALGWAGLWIVRSFRS